MGLRLFLIKIGVLKLSAEEAYLGLIQGFASAHTIYRYLALDQIEKFILLHRHVRAFLNDERQDLPPQIAAAFMEFVAENPRRLHLALVQIDNLIERDLEKNILRVKGKANVVRRDS